MNMELPATDGYEAEIKVTDKKTGKHLSAPMTIHSKEDFETVKLLIDLLKVESESDPSGNQHLVDGV